MVDPRLPIESQSGPPACHAGGRSDPNPFGCEKVTDWITSAMHDFSGLIPPWSRFISWHYLWTLDLPLFSALLTSVMLSPVRRAFDTFPGFIGPTEPQ